MPAPRRIQGEVKEPKAQPTPSATTSERRLLRSARRGSEEATEQIAELLWRYAYAAALAMLGSPAAASDVAQDSVMKALDSLERFDPRRPLRPWINRIATNTALDLLRSERRRGDVSLKAEPVAPQGAELLLEVIESLQGLEPDVRSMVVLRHLGGFDSSEIAEILGLKATTVRSAMSRGLTELAAGPLTAKETTS